MPFLAPRNPASLRPLLFAVLAAMLALHAWAFFTLRHKMLEGYPDFAAFYAAGKCVQKGLGPRLYEIPTQFRLQQEFVSPAVIGKGPLPFIHPPFEAVLFAPLALLPYATACWVWNAASLLALLGCLLLLRPYLPHLRTVSETLPFLAGLAFFPVFACLREGQDSLLLLLILAMVFAAIKLERDFLGGVLLGLGLFRFQLVLPLVAIAIVRRKWKLLGGFSVATLGLMAISAAVVGWGPLWKYPQQLWQLSRAQTNFSMNPSYMPNLRGVVFSLAGDGDFAHGVIAVATLALLGLAAWKWKADPRQRDFDLGFGLALAAVAISSYHMMTHDLTVLLIPLLLAAEWLVSERPVGVTRNLLLVAIGLLFLTPIGLRLQRFGALFWTMALLIAALTVALGRHPAPQLAQAASGKKA